MKKKINVGSEAAGTKMAPEQVPKLIFIEDGLKQPNDKNKQTENRGPVEYEEAILACGFGKFNYLLIATLVPTACAQLFGTGTISYVLPSAECDLKLTNVDKGSLNACTYGGMILSAFLWGFILDVFGRRKLIIIGFLLDFTFNFLASFAHRFEVLLVLKFFGGLSLPGPNAAIFTYLAETHSNVHRPKIIMIIGAFFAFAQAVQPIVAYLVIPLTFRYPLIPGVLDFTSWRLFIMMCSMPSLLSAVLFMFFPESPKFLMSQGRTTEALHSFKRIYAANCATHQSHYPIKELVIPPGVEAENVVDGKVQKHSVGLCTVIRNGWSQVSPIFRPPYLNMALLLFGVQVLIMICFNSMRLWAPQLFSTLNIASSSQSPAVAQATTVCDLLTFVKPASSGELAAENYTCLPVKGEVYLRSLIIGVAATVSFLISTPLIGFLGKQNLAKICFPIGAVLAAAMNWATNTDMFMAFIGVYIGVVENGLSIMSSIVVDSFPTAFRSMAISLHMMSGRIGSMSGNLLFPVILSISCPAIFFFLAGALLFISAVLWIIPRRDEKH